MTENSNKKLILHVAEAPGGVERYLVTLLKKIKKYSEFEHILVCSEAFDVGKFDGIVSRVVVMPEMKHQISLSQDGKAVKALRKIIREYHPDIVYCHSSKAGVIGRLANLWIKNKLIYNAHGWAFNMQGMKKVKTLFYSFAESILSLMSDKIVCISEYERISALKKKICGPKKLVLINSGIDLDAVEKINPKQRKDIGIPEDAFVVGTVGRLTAQKASDSFVKMAAEIKKAIPNAFFLMVGDSLEHDSYREGIDKLISDFALEDSFCITGWVDNPMDYMNCFDVATLLSRWEGFGLVLPEYMLMNKPIVGSKADAIPYVLGDAGLLVDVDDYKYAANCVIEIHQNKTLANQLVNAGKERVLLFDAQRMADEYITLFS